MVYSRSAVLPMPGSPRKTSVRLSHSRTAFSKPSSIAVSTIRSNNRRRAGARIVPLAFRPPGSRVLSKVPSDFILSGQFALVVEGELAGLDYQQQDGHHEIASQGIHRGRSGGRPGRPVQQREGWHAPSVPIPAIDHGSRADLSSPTPDPQPASGKCED